jgi:hypothetical protein
MKESTFGLQVRLQIQAASKVETGFAPEPLDRQLQLLNFTDLRLALQP